MSPFLMTVLKRDCVNDVDFEHTLPIIAYRKAYIKIEIFQRAQKMKLGALFLGVTLAECPCNEISEDLDYGKVEGETSERTKLGSFKTTAGKTLSVRFFRNQ